MVAYKIIPKHSKRVSLISFQVILKSQAERNFFLWILFFTQTLKCWWNLNLIFFWLWVSLTFLLVVRGTNIESIQKTKGTFCNCSNQLIQLNQSEKSFFLDNLASISRSAWERNMMIKWTQSIRFPLFFLFVFGAFEEENLFQLRGIAQKIA